MSIVCREDKYKWQYYANRYDEEALTQFRNAVGAIKQICEDEKWIIDCKLNQQYVGFKLGRRLIVWVHWLGTYNWEIALHIPESIAENLSLSTWNFRGYIDDASRFAPVNRHSLDATELKKLLNLSYENVRIIRRRR